LALDIDVGQLPAEAVIASSNKCLEGVPGMGFVIMRRDSLLASRGNSHSLALDLLAQYEYMQSTGQWRFTPPTHVVAALRMALDQYLAEGGQPARLARYQRNAAVLQHQLQQAGLQLFLPAALQPHHPDLPRARSSGLSLRPAVRSRARQGLRALPRQAHQPETFRVGCIGAIDQAELEQACHAIITTIRELGWTTRKLNMQGYQHLEAVIFDWAGTVVDFGPSPPPRF
jgi:2-aminoethylphosphonate-pyruvate transaminase